MTFDEEINAKYQSGQPHNNLKIIALKPAVGYARTSDPKQKDNGSIEIQKQEIKRHAEKHGYTIIRWFIDISVSAYHYSVLNRQEMLNLKKFITESNTQAEAIFFYDETRVSRRFNDFVVDVVIPIRVKKPYMEFYSTNQNGPWNENDFIVKMRLFFGLQESNHKKSHMRTIRKSNLENHIRPDGRLPFGFKKSDFSSVEVDENEATIVQFIFYLASWGHSTDDIATILNMSDIPSPDGTKWIKTTINQMLNNISYIGHYSHIVRDDEGNNATHQIFNDLHVPLLPVYRWELAQQTRRLKKKLGGKLDTPFILRNLIKCKKCDTELEVKDRTPSKSLIKYRQYHCPICKNKVDIQQVHNVFLQLFEKEISGKLLESKKFTINQLKEWKKGLEMQINILNDDIKYYQIKHDNLTHEEENAEFWLKSLESTIQGLKQQKLEIALIISNIDLLLTKVNLDSFFEEIKNLKIRLLSRIEQRVLVYMLTNSVSIAFRETEYLLDIDFRFMPFFELESDILRKTENDIA